MKSKLKENKVSLVLVIITFLLIILNIFTSNTMQFSMSENKVTDDGYVEYSPAFSLNKGEYEFNIKSEAKNAVTLNILSADNGVILSSVLKPQNNLVKLKLDEHTNGLKFLTESDEAVITDVKLKSDMPLYTDVIWVSVLVLFALLFILWLKKSDVLEEKASVFIVLAAAVVASYPLFMDYVQYGHDISFHLWRIEGIADGIRSGQFPVRIHPTHNNGYGYITASVYPELFLYFPALLRLLGVSLPTAYKSLLFGMNVLTAIIMYYSAKEVTKSRFSATVASVIYTLATWRLINLYARAALGEGMAMTFIPLVIAGFYNIIKGDNKKWYLLTVAFTCIFQTHVISTVLIAILSVVLALVFLKDIISQKRWLSAVKVIFTTVLVNLWYLVPFVTYYFGHDLIIRQPRINTQFFSNSIFPAELFNILNTNFGFSRLLPEGIRGNLSLSLGFGVSVCLIFALAYFIFNRDEKTEEEKFNKVYFMCGIGFLFAATTLFPWQLLQQHALVNKFADLVRMPWRFLSIASPLITLSAAHILKKYCDSDRVKKTVLFTVCAVCTVFMIHFGTAFTTQVNTEIVKCEMPTESKSIGYDDEYLIKGTVVRELTPQKYAATEGVKINSFEKSGTNITMNVSNTTANGYVEVPLLYYKGYKATDANNNRLEIVCGNNNVMRVHIKDANGDIKIKHNGFVYFRIAELISLLTLLWMIFSKRIKKRIR